MDVFVMRHGTTVWNEKGITQGRTNNRLSESGKLLVETASKKHAKTNFEVIVCSPLIRTVQTANIMNMFHNVKVIKDERLIEIDQGIFAGRAWKSLTEKEKQQKKERSKKCFMETYDEAFKRTENFVLNLKAKYPYKTILIVTHNIIASFIEDILEKKPKDFNDNGFVKNFDNAEIKHFEI